MTKIRILIVAAAGILTTLAVAGAAEALRRDEPLPRRRAGTLVGLMRSASFTGTATRLSVECETERPARVIAGRFAAKVLSRGSA